MSMAAHVVSREDEQARVLSLLTRVGRTYVAARESPHEVPKLHEAILQLEQLIFSFDDDSTDAPHVRAISAEMVAEANEAYSFWENRTEYEFAQRLVKGEVILADYLFYRRFDTLIQRELALIAPSRPGRVLFAGCGALPISAMLLHARTGASVDCLVRDRAVLDISREVIELAHHGGSIRVLGDAQSNYDIGNYDLIVIAVQFTAKKSILKAVRKRCRPGVHVLCRTVYGLRQLLHRGTQERERRGFHVKAKQVAEGPETISTWVLEAAEAAAADVRLEWLETIGSDTAEQLLLLMNRTLEEETTIGFPGPIDEETGYVLMRQLNQDVEKGRRHVLVAYKDGAIVGQLILTPNGSPNHGHIVELTRGTIDPSFRGGGLALRAFLEIVKKCKQLGREVICLDVRAGTQAAIWWQHFGFKQYGLLQDYSRVGKKRYQGLYLTQTASELQQRLETLQRMKANTSPK
jgi:GNAT superfamily N-acetyltransferase